MAKAEFIKSNLEENHKDARKFWKSLSDLIVNKGKQTSVIKLITQSDNNVDHDKTADFMNDFFASIGPTLASNYNKSWTYQGQIYNCVFPDMLTNDEEVLKLCKEIQETKSSAIDSLSSMILKHAFLALIPKLTFLLNLSLKSGKFPQIWKQAVVIPLAKEGDTSNVGNYRPISLLPLPGKILEKIVHDRLMSYLEANNILDKNQGGFRKNHSTTDTIVKFTQEIFSAMNNKEVSLVTFIDLKKNFHTVDHQILIRKLEILGIRNKSLTWFSSYLGNRTQKTIANNMVSSLRNITCGVPQGSILGSLLFLIYINDLAKVIRNCKIFLYADDTVLVATGSVIHNVYKTMQTDLDKISEWCVSNKLTVNVKKTKAMLLGTRSIMKRTNCQPLALWTILRPCKLL